MKKVNLRFDTGNGIYEGTVSEYSFNLLKNFTQIYELEKVLDGNEVVTIGGKKLKKDRTCRFCKKSYPEVSFNNEAHIIPQQWNKAKPISSFECDNCNERFSIFESDFGYYFLIDRSLLGKKKKKKGRAKFKTSKGTSISTPNFNDIIYPDSEEVNELKKEIQEKNVTVVEIRQGIDESEIKINETNIVCNLIRRPYKPLNVFRVFLKVGLSMLREEDLGNYTSLFNLMDSNFKIEQKDEFDCKQVSLYHFRFPILKSIFEHPIAYLFKRIKHGSLYIERTLVIFFGDSIYQIPLLSNDDFRRIYQNKENLKLIKASPYWNPYLSQDTFEDENFMSIVSDITESAKCLYSLSTVTDDLERFTIYQD